jgi:CBS domain-containing protein
MTTAREVMNPDADWIDADATVEQAAQMMSDESFGMLPVCDGQGQLQGVVTDRDIIVKVIAEGLDPRTTRLAQLADQDQVVTIGADDSVEEAIDTMKRYGVRRLPVIDGTALVGMVSQADIARALPDAKVGDLVGAISEQPPNN